MTNGLWVHSGIHGGSQFPSDALNLTGARKLLAMHRNIPAQAATDRKPSTEQPENLAMHSSTLPLCHNRRQRCNRPFAARFAAYANPVPARQFLRDAGATQVPWTRSSLEEQQTGELSGIA